MKVGTETLKEAVTDYLLTQHPEFSAIPDELRDFILEYERKKRKHTVFLVYRIGYEGKFRIGAKYENITENEVPFKIMKDASLGKSVCWKPVLFRRLLEYRRNLLKDHEIFAQAVKNMEELDMDGPPIMVGSWCDVDPKLIEYLYTKILTPQDLIDDICVLHDYTRYHICFENDDTRPLLVLGGVLKE